MQPSRSSDLADALRSDLEGDGRVLAEAVVSLLDRLQKRLGNHRLTGERNGGVLAPMLGFERPDVARIQAISVLQTRGLFGEYVFLRSSISFVSCIALRRCA